MKNQSIEAMLLKELHDPSNRGMGRRYRLPNSEVLIINPRGTAAFIFDVMESFHLADKFFPFIERLPFKDPALDDENLLTDTGKTYIDDGLLKLFDKTAMLYQQDGALTIVAVVEKQITGEYKVMGYVMPCHAPAKTTKNT
jgi:hypothetical protein